LCKPERTDLKGSNNFLRVAVDDFLKNPFALFLSLRAIAVKTFFNEPFADAVPKRTVVGRIHFPGILFDSDAFLINGLYEYVREVFFVFGDDAPECMFINFAQKLRAILAQPVRWPIFNALNDAGIYFDFFFHN